MVSQEAGDFDKEILLERYEVQQELSKKAGRRTLLARDLQTQKIVVVKLLSFGDDFEWNDLKLFEREAETLKALSHPAIPKYLEYFELDLSNHKGFASVQSYIPAQSLAEQLKAGRSFSEVEVKQLALAILKILQYLHGRQPGVIHRDIKPSNILLTNHSGNSVGDIYLVDFGSVQTVVKRSSTMTVVGTYGYMPPEQFGGRATPASDLYSLGVTLIYLVTGQHPADLPQTDLRIEFEQAANISPGFSSWLKRMTKPIASQRFISAEEAMQALEQAENTTQAQAKANNSSIPKPGDSEVVLNKNSNYIEIIIPPIGFYTSVVYRKLILILGIIGYNIFLILCICIPFLSINSAYIFVFLLEFLIFIIIAYYIWEVLMLSFGQMKLFINQYKIFCSYKLFGESVYKREWSSFLRIFINNWYSSHNPSPRQNIIRLERTKATQNTPYLTIWAGRQKYEIGNNINFPLTTPEVDWLASELSDWLDLPITRE